MISKGEHQPIWWVCLNVVVILISAILTTYPPSQHFGALIIPFDLIFLPVYFFLYIRRERSTGDLDIPLNKLYRRARAGRRLRANTLETLAAVSLLLASVSIASH
jgi:hypothetical protein